MKRIVVDKPIDYNKFRCIYEKDILTKESALQTKTAFDEFLFGDINCDGTFSCYRHLKQNVEPLNLEWYYIAIFGRVIVGARQTTIEYSYKYNSIWRLARLGMMALFLLFGIYQRIWSFTLGNSYLFVGILLVVFAIFLGGLVLINPESKILKNAIRKIIDQC